MHIFFFANSIGFNFLSIHAATQESLKKTTEGYKIMADKKVLSFRILAKRSCLGYPNQRQVLNWRVQQALCLKNQTFGNYREDKS